MPHFRKCQSPADELIAPYDRQTTQRRARYAAWTLDRPDLERWGSSCAARLGPER